MYQIHCIDDDDYSNNKKNEDDKKENEIIIIFINCNWVVTRWQWLFYVYTKYETGY